MIFCISFSCVVKNTYVVTVIVALGWENQSQANISQVLWKCLYFPRKNMFWFQSWSAATYNKAALRPVDFGRLSFLCCYSSCLLTKFFSVGCSAHFSTTTTSLGALFDSTRETHLGFTHDCVCARTEECGGVAIYFFWPLLRCWTTFVINSKGPNSKYRKRKATIFDGLIGCDTEKFLLLLCFWQTYCLPFHFPQHFQPCFNAI